MKLNCWEFNGCGREAGGGSIDEYGVCPAYEEQSLDGVHDGSNAGRACWVIAGTMCGGEVLGTHAKNVDSCVMCDFYQRVRDEELGSFMMIPVIRKILVK